MIAHPKTRPILVGEMPSRTGDRYWRFPLSGKVGVRLATWAGLEQLAPAPGQTFYGRRYWALRQVFDVVNVRERHDPAGGPLDAARHAALLERLRDRPAVVLLGRAVERALELPLYRRPGEQLVEAPLFEVVNWFEPLRSVPSAPVVVIPHPSPLNRLYNEPGLCLRAGRTLRELAERAGTWPTPGAPPWQTSS
jgi:uracil-DNA glycosylase